MSKTTIYPLLFFLLLAGLQVNAQRRNGNPPEDAKASQIFEILPVAGKGYVTIFTDRGETPSKVRMIFTGASETVEAENELSLVRRGLSGMVESAFIWEGQLTLITSLFYPGPQRDLLFIRRFSLPDLEEVASEKIAEAYVPGRLRIPFGYALSPDSTQIMFYSWSYAVPEDPVKMEIHVLDQQLTRQWTKRFLLPNKNENFYIYACKVDNDGNAYLLCEDYKGKIGARIRDDKIERFVLRLDQNTSEAVSFAIQLPDKVITDLRFTMDKQGNLYGAGLYRDAKKVFQAGVFAYRIDQKTQGFRKKEIPISKEDYQAAHPYADADGKHVSGTRQFRDFFIDRLDWDEQEGLTMIGEQRIYDDDKDTYRDILVIQLDTTLRKSWMTRIPKDQSTLWGQPTFASYTYLSRGDQKYILFNDEAENMPGETDLPSRIRSFDLQYSTPTPILHMVKIGENGVLQHQNLSTVIRAGSKTGLVPAMTRSDQENTFLLYMVNLNNPEAEGEVFPISWMRK
ncbi:hypothetical protein [Flavilitoribacter nigricans]|uniref:Uncharacterized protein n=1 Tax=Flavilitoribacter nigricans (strain ATCC 23147 / DSM 23189 / NBRC 102662 / NCIMB 1420 / SS-2) TaxID=1122177 RepID=A0A2D0N850_FLAN2|nr:hypothetical protein [Flavilitoribacter nigricans]PHN03923.1 hypothetical protein CRP01_23925 [Flavilitoribacter nigricans DSM 23189 = NBRC 102662]